MASPGPTPRARIPAATCRASVVDVAERPAVRTTIRTDRERLGCRFGQPVGEQTPERLIVPEAFRDVPLPAFDFDRSGREVHGLSLASSCSRQPVADDSASTRMICPHIERDPDGVAEIDRGRALEARRIRHRPGDVTSTVLADAEANACCERAKTAGEAARRVVGSARQAEHPLGDDVALDLARPARDRAR